jgi:dTDP-L-rhamnose 4-epimerase
MTTVLVTGGAGFIGSHLVDALIARGARVRVLDNLLPQAHPTGEPRFVHSAAEFILGDVCDADTVARALSGVAIVYHLAGMVGNGQSMYDVRRYTEANVVGTANLVQCMIERTEEPFERLVVSSSMVVYGDGAYACATHGSSVQTLRPRARLQQRKWEPICSVCGAEVRPIATDENHRQQPTSTYGTSKRAQEELALVLGRAHKLPTIALRYLNTYGSRQALSNPYTGVAAIMASRIRNGSAPHIFEDGGQLRDFTHVSDVVRANLHAGKACASALYAPYNIGTGRSRPIAEIASVIAGRLDPTLQPVITGEFREGDIRHCFADVSQARHHLDWEARVPLEDGIGEFLDWAKYEKPTDHSDQANAELRSKGLIW